MKHLIVDTEQAAIIEQTLTGVSAFLKARATRRDPVGFISKAYKLQDRKVANLKFQLEQGDIAKWEELSMSEQTAFLNLLDAMRDGKTDHYRHLCYNQIMHFIMAHRVQTVEQQSPQALIAERKVP